MVYPKHKIKLPTTVSFLKKLIIRDLSGLSFPKILFPKILSAISEVFKKEVEQARRYKEQQPHPQLSSGFLTVLSLKQSSMKSILCTFPFFRLLRDPVPRIVPDEPFITVL